MDVHVPYAITRGLRLRGVDVMTAQEDGAGELSDTAILLKTSSQKSLSNQHPHKRLIPKTSGQAEKPSFLLERRLPRLGS